jgi:MerR family transcriptional regulator, heat shock protein HspR
VTARLDELDDPDYPAYTTGGAAEMLGVRQAFLRALDTAGAVTPQRSAGGRRRYTRRQLAFAARIRELFDQGHTLVAALRILTLEDDLAAERALTASLRERLGRDQGRRGRRLVRTGRGILRAAGPAGPGLTGSWRGRRGCRPVPAGGPARPAAAGFPPEAAGPGGCRRGSSRRRSARRSRPAGRCPGGSTGGCRPRCARGPTALHARRSAASAGATRPARRQPRC